MVIALAAGAAAACASNDKVDVSDEEYDDIAISIATTLRTDDGGGELGALADAIQLANGSTPAGFAAEPSGDVVGMRTDVTYRYDLVCRDAAGAVLVSCDEQATSAEADVLWGGPLAVPYDARVIGRNGRWALAGLGGDAVIITGRAELAYVTKYESPVRGVTTSYEVQHDTEVLYLELAPGVAFPRAGSLHYLVEASRTRARENNQDTRDLELDVIVAFDGTSRAVLSLDDDPGDGKDPRRTYDLDLPSGALVRTGANLD